jgi:hypothetical protein
LRTPRDVSSSTKAAAALAAISVGAAIFLSLQPHRLEDLRSVVAWTSQWLGGANLYGPGADTDYPPWAIVTLSPLAVIPAAAVPAFWIACNLIALTFVARRLSQDRPDLYFLLIAAGTIRTLNQFSLVTLALAIAGTTSSGRLSPLWLGLSLMKPQIGGVFWLNAMWKRQWRLAAIACAVPLVLMAVFAARAHVSILSLPREYAQSIAVAHADLPRGQTELTPMVHAIWPGASYGFIAVLVAISIFVPLARRESVAGFALASLLSIRHLSYDLILLLPRLATTGGAMLWVGTALLVADPAAVARVIAPESWLAHNADRLVLLAIWACLALNRRQEATL